MALNLTEIDRHVGMQTLSKALKNAALEIPAEDQREVYLADNDEGYGDKVFRVTDVESIDCWYGYIYTQNGSPFRLRETLQPELTGLEVVWPESEPDKDCIEVDIPAFNDHIIILRRNSRSCQYGLRYLTHPRELNDSELIEITKQLEDKQQFGESKAFYKLYNTQLGAVFYFENAE